MPTYAEPGSDAVLVTRSPAPVKVEQPAAAAAAGESARTRWDWFPWLIAALVFAAYSLIAATIEMRFQTTSWDLGIFTEYVRQFAHLRAPVVDARAASDAPAGMDLLGDHFHPIVALLAPFFRAFPTPMTLLIAQAALAAVSVVPVSRAAEAHLGRNAGRLVGTAYGLSWGLQQMAANTFHEIAFAVPLLAFSLSALTRDRVRAAVIWALPLVFVKEDQGFTLAAYGLVIAFAYRHKLAGLGLAVWGLVWSIVSITVIIPHFNPAHVYSYWGHGGQLGTITQFSAIRFIGQFFASFDVKTSTVLLILLPTAFLALRSPLVLAAVPSIVLRFISTDAFNWGTGFHYNATVMPIVFIAAIDGIARIRAYQQGAKPAGSLAGRLTPVWNGLSRHGTAMMLAICAALAFQFPLSSLWKAASYSTGSHVAADERAMKLVPDGATVAASVDLTAPLAARADAFTLAYGADVATKYVVYDSYSGDVPPPAHGTLLTMIEGLCHGAHYRQVFDSQGVYVFIRTS